MSSVRLAVGITARRKLDRKCRNVVALADRRNALLLHFINTNDGLDRNEAAFDAGKLTFKLFFAGINHHLTALAEHKVFYLDEAVEVTLVHLADVDFIDLALIQKGDTKEITRVGAGFVVHNTSACYC